MDFSSLPLFGAMKRQLSWLGQRQEVLAQNVANSDTPDYKPKDLKPVDFRKMVTGQSRRVNMEVTDGQHLAGRHVNPGPFGEGKGHKPYETAPDGNAVVLEEQMTKVAETTVSHQATTQLYNKHLKLFRIVLGR